MARQEINKYEYFVGEALIQPIRSVLIVDDDYPTLDEVLTSDKRDGGKKWHSKPDPIYDVINSFRTSDPARIVDVHDGLGLDDDAQKTLAQHLHQSDLLVLDYELKDKGDRALNILRNVLNNNHFNLVIVHSTRDADEIFLETLLSMLSKSEEIDGDIVELGKEILARAEGIDKNAKNSIQNAIGIQQYTNFRKSRRGATNSIKNGDPPFGDFSELVTKFKLTRAEPFKLLCWALDRFEKNNEESMLSTPFTDISWHDNVTGGPLWIRTSKGFISFVRKENGIDLLSKLKDSLLSWGPSPSRLLSAKLRSSIDNDGVIAEDLALKNISGHAKFFEGVVSKGDNSARVLAIESQIDRYMAGLTHEIKNEVTDYFSKLIKANDGFEKYYKIDLDDEKENELAIKSFNSYVSCLPSVTGWHLMPGHIIDIGGDGDLWVCLSPICDLVPDQKKHGIHGAVGEARKPFLAVQLHKRADKKHLLVGTVHSNNYIFLESAPTVIEQYGFFESGTDDDSASSPYWNIFVAEKNGCFGKDNKIELVQLAEAEMEPDGPSTLTVTTNTAEIVAQLRYEYALNFINKLGSDMTRVGLSYIGLPRQP